MKSNFIIIELENCDVKIMHGSLICSFFFMNLIKLSWLINIIKNRLNKDLTYFK